MLAAFNPSLNKYFDNESLCKYCKTPRKEHIMQQEAVANKDNSEFYIIVTRWICRDASND